MKLWNWLNGYVSNVWVARVIVALAVLAWAAVGRVFFLVGSVCGYGWLLTHLFTRGGCIGAGM